MLGILGAGAMGQGIAQVAAQNGIAVAMIDTAPGAAADGRSNVLQRIDLIARGKVASSAKVLIRVAAS